MLRFHWGLSITSTIALNKLKLCFHDRHNEETWEGHSLQKIIEKQMLNFERDSQPFIRLAVDSAPKSTIDLVAALLSEKPMVVVDATLSARQFQEQMAQLNASSIHKDCKLILFSSGSLGQPKGIQLSLKNIEESCRAIVRALPFESSSHQNLFLPLSYSFALLGQLLPALKIGLETHIYKDYVSAAGQWQRKGLDGMWSGLTLHARKWLDTQTKAKSDSRLSLIFAGQAVPEAVRRSLLTKFPNALISVNYGLTEASSRVLSMDSRDPLFISDRSGYPISNWQTRLNAQGELEIKGPQVMLGYLVDSDSKFTEDGWLMTKDLATIHDNGCLEILGRSDSIRFIGSLKIDLGYLQKEVSCIEGVVEAACEVNEPLQKIFFSIHPEEATDITQLTNRITEVLLQLGIPRKALGEFKFGEIPRHKSGKINIKAL